MERYSLQFRERAVESVLQRGQSKFVQLSFEPGKGLTKHCAPLALTVIVLTGRIRFTVGNRTEVLEAMDMLALDPNVEHAVEAIERSTVLLVLTPDSE
jgi:quercetin dioxygenase-like cupin family protein